MLVLGLPKVCYSSPWFLGKTGVERIAYQTAQLTQLCVVIDGGNVPFSITRTPTVGSAIAAILTRPHDTKNRAVFILEGITTQNKLIAHAENILSLAGDKPKRTPTFNITHIDSAAAEQAAWKAFHRPASDLTEWASPFINLSLWSGRELCHFANTDNELLGFRELRGAELDAMLCEEIEKAAKSFGLVGRCNRSQVLEAETRAYRALETGKGSLSIGGGCCASGSMQQESEVSL
jgi:hypothetical protein